MNVLGIVFAGTATAARVEMAEFVRDVLGLVPMEATSAAGVEMR